MEAEGWGLVKVMVMEGASLETLGPPCHRTWVVLLARLVWDCRRGGDFILTKMEELHRGKNRIQDVENASMYADDG